jgi:nitroreductase
MKNTLIAVISACFVMLVASCQGGSQEKAVSTPSVNNGNAVIETIMSRRSIRKYKPQKVGRDTVETIVRCGIYAPNAMNKQEWEIRVVDNKADISRLTEIYKRYNEKAAKDPSMVTMFRNAWTVVFVAKTGGSDINVGLLGENMALAAWSMGVGSCFLGGPIGFLTKTEEVRPFIDKLELPEDAELVYCLALGYPDESPEAKPRDADKIRFIE